jgi:HSP20 family protein
VRSSACLTLRGVTWRSSVGAAGPRAPRPDARRIEETAMALPLLRRNHASGDEQTVEKVDRRHHTADGWGPPVGLSPWAELGELHDRMGRLLSETFGKTFPDADRGGGGWRPAADVEETDEAYVVELELPGVNREDVSVEFGGGELAVTGEVKKRERVGFLRTRTRPVGRFDYRVHLPAEVEQDQVTASLSDGVLTVRVPKSEHARRRRIPISS